MYRTVCLCVVALKWWLLPAYQGWDYVTSCTVLTQAGRHVVVVATCTVYHPHPPWETHWLYGWWWSSLYVTCVVGLLTYVRTCIQSYVRVCMCTWHRENIMVGLMSSAWRMLYWWITARFCVVVVSILICKIVQQSRRNVIIRKKKNSRSAVYPIEVVVNQWIIPGWHGNQANLPPTHAHMYTCTHTHAHTCTKGQRDPQITCMCMHMHKCVIVKTDIHMYSIYVLADSILK